jgi:hypothetical protein
VAAKFIMDPLAIIEQARERLAVLRREESNGARHLVYDRWEKVLDEGPFAVLEVLTGQHEADSDMRSFSPLCGLDLISQEERARVVEAFNTYWWATHDRPEPWCPPGYASVEEWLTATTRSQSKIAYTNPTGETL